MVFQVGLFLLSFIVLFVALTVALPGVVEVYTRCRRGHFVVCPETQKQGAVVVSAGLAAASSALLPTKFRIKDCTLWPEQRPCSRRCLLQVRSISRLPG
jgi:hypothetical protein